MPDIFVPNKPIIKQAEAETQSPRHFHRFASFCTHPLGLSFENQESDEKILLFLRKHFVTNLSWIIIAIFLIFIPLFLAVIFSMIKINIFPFFIPSGFILVTTLFYYLGIAMYAFIKFIMWFYDVGIVTQKKVIDVDFEDIIHHDVAITKLSLVQDVIYEQTGPIRSFLNFGDVFIQTAGNNPNFDFLAVPQPGNVIHIIQDLIGKEPHPNA